MYNLNTSLTNEVDNNLNIESFDLSNETLIQDNSNEYTNNSNNSEGSIPLLDNDFIGKKY